MSNNDNIQCQHHLYHFWNATHPLLNFFSCICSAFDSTLYCIKTCQSMFAQYITNACYSSWSFSSALIWKPHLGGVPGKKRRNKSSEGMKLISLFFLVWACCALTCQPVASYSVEARGRVLCSGQAVPEVQIRLMDDDPLFDDFMGSTTTDSQGYFRVTGEGRDIFNGKPDPYVQIRYQYSGLYGRMKVDRFSGIVRKEETADRRNTLYVNYGTLRFNNIHCKSYIQVYKALKDFYVRTRLGTPYSVLRVRSDAKLARRRPWASLHVIRIPRAWGYFSLEEAKHELAHTIRHTYDGSWGHFRRDAIRFKYATSHSCDTRVNEGFAFNEGWANFWDGSCNAGSYGGSANDFTIEGNVANALRRLQRKCRSSDRRMVNVLRLAGERTIHSFHQYNLKHGSLTGCRLYY